MLNIPDPITDPVEYEALIVLFDQLLVIEYVLPVFRLIPDPPGANEALIA